MLAKLCSVSREDVEEALEGLDKTYKDDMRGLALVRNGIEVQLTTAPQHALVVAAFLEEEVQSDLSRAALETLTILAYRGPMSKTDLEGIRGVNCTLILRNLAMKGLVETVTLDLHEKYRVSFACMRILGLQSTHDLPDYEALNKKLDACTREQGSSNV